MQALIDRLEKEVAGLNRSGLFRSSSDGAGPRLFRDLTIEPAKAASNEKNGFYLHGSASSMRDPRVWVHATLIGRGYYASGPPFRVRLEFGLGERPTTCVFLTSITHYLVDGSTGVLEAPFPPGVGVQRALEGVLSAFESPVHPCESCNARFEHAAREHAERVVRIRGFVSALRQPRLFDAAAGWSEDWFDPRYLAAARRGGGLLDTCSSTAAGTEADACRTGARSGGGGLAGLLDEVVPGAVWAFPLLTPAFCDALVGEIEHLDTLGLPVKRPNSMNNYGMILNDVGFEGMASALQRDHLAPIAKHLWGGAQGASLDVHHTFVVRYEAKPGRDFGLDMHTDDSDVTFNVCLGKEFEGGELAVCGVMRSAAHRRLAGVLPHAKGRCLVHLGSQRHGAQDVRSGERVNLIVWNRSAAWRQGLKDAPPGYEREGAAPDPLCLSFTHDRDYKEFCAPKDAHKQREEDSKHTPWCPPRGREHHKQRPPPAAAAAVGGGGGSMQYK